MADINWDDLDAELDFESGSLVKEPVKWLSHTKCDFCRQDCTKVGDTFVDGKTQYGPWALMCTTCHKIHGIPKMGTGYGQRYSSATRLKVEG